MTANEALALMGELRPHPLPAQVLTRALGELDGQLYGEFLSRYEAGEEQPFDPAEEPDRPLLAPAPYDGIYISRLAFLIDTALGETTRANNAAALFNRDYAALAAYLNRNYSRRAYTAIDAGWGLASGKEEG